MGSSGVENDLCKNHKSHTLKTWLWRSLLNTHPCVVTLPVSVSLLWNTHIEYGQMQMSPLKGLFPEQVHFGVSGKGSHSDKQMNKFEFQQVKHQSRQWPLNINIGKQEKIVNG